MLFLSASESFFGIRDFTQLFIGMGGSSKTDDFLNYYYFLNSSFNEEFDILVKASQQFPPCLNLNPMLFWK